MKTMNTNTIILIASMLIASVLPISAQTLLPMQSTSAMQQTGSQHQSQVREAYAPDVRYKLIPMRSTSTMMQVEVISTPQFEEADPNPAIRRGRKGFDTGGESGRSDEYPVGEPYVLLLFAAACAAVTTLRRYRRRKAALCEQCNISKTE